MLSSSHTHVGRRAKRISNSDGNNTESGETKPLTESEMNKLGAKIVKAELMGNTVCILINVLRYIHEMCQEIVKIHNIFFRNLLMN